jgi:peroxiredoxin
LSEAGLTYINLAPGEPAPWIHQRSTSSPNYAFDTVGGRYVVLCFFMSAGDAAGQSALRAVEAHRDRFDDERACFFGVSVDPEDEAQARVTPQLPGIRFFWDFDGSISRAYGAVPMDASKGQALARRFWAVLDPTLRFLATFSFDDDSHSDVFKYLDSLSPPDPFAGFEVFAPVLVLPNVFQPDFCQELVGLYEANGGEESGFMHEVGGKTVGHHDPSHKRRRDYIIEDSDVIKRIRGYIVRRVIPEIRKVYSFNATRMERYIVSCYAAEEGGHFRPHRDNTTKGTVHRRFAISINLNSDFEGGELMFPEYSSRTYKAPPGGAMFFPEPFCMPSRK